jgi:MFS family permease
MPSRFARLPVFYGWIIVGIAFITMGIGVNARTAFSLLLPPIINEFGWDRGLVAGAFSFGFFLSAFFAPFIGRLMDQKGPVIVVEIGVILTALGLGLAAFAREPWHFYGTLGFSSRPAQTFWATACSRSSSRAGSCAGVASPSASHSQGSASDRSRCCRGCSS